METYVNVLKDIAKHHFIGKAISSMDSFNLQKYYYQAFFFNYYYYYCQGGVYEEPYGRGGSLVSREAILDWSSTAPRKSYPTPPGNATLRDHGELYDCN